MQRRQGGGGSLQRQGLKPFSVRRAWTLASCSTRGTDETTWKE
jgi:hypothetical protein